MNENIEDKYDRLRNLYCRKLGTCNEEALDKHYMSTANGSWTRRQLINEVRNDTEFGRQQIDMMLNLTLHIMEKDESN